jgi:hypothetical protein
VTEGTGVRARDLARLLLGGTSVEQALTRAAERLAGALELPWAAIELGTTAERADSRGQGATFVVSLALEVESPLAGRPADRAGAP